MFDVMASVGFVAVALMCLPPMRASLRDRIAVWRSKRRMKRAAKARLHAAVWQ